MAAPCPDPYPPLTSNDRDDLLNAVKRHYQRFGFRVTILRSRSRPTGEVYRVTLACDRGGRARNSSSQGIRAARSQKTGCQWQGDLMRTGEEWMFIPSRFIHNHPPPLATEPGKDTVRARAEALARKRAAERGRVRHVLPTLHLGSFHPGIKNSLTDVPGVLVSVQSAQPTSTVNTGVTVILPRKEWLTEACHANVFRFNGAGEVTGAHWIQESGLLNSPIVITNSLSVGDAYRGIYDWAIRHHASKSGELEAFLLPVVAETYDGYLNDICKMSVKPQDITRGIDLCTDDPVPEGNTGGGTGMICHHWKGGTGSASRVVPGFDADGDEETYTVGVLVQANYGKAQHLRIGGAPVGRILHEQNAHEKIIQQKSDDAQREEEERVQREQRRQQQYEEQLRAQSGPPQPGPGIDQAFAQAGQLASQLQQQAAAAHMQRQSRQSSAGDDAQIQAQLRWQANVAAHKQRKDGSIIVVLATDAPLSSTQCERLAKRATVGLSRVGGYGHNMSGDIFIAFSTGNSIPVSPIKLDGPPETDPSKPKHLNIATVDSGTVDGLFEAAADATEEAIYNALFMAQSMEGFKGRKVEALPLKWVKDIMEKYL